MADAGGQCSQVQARCPAFRSIDQSVDIVLAGHDPGSEEKGPGLLDAHRQLSCADLEQLTLCRKRGEGSIGCTREDNMSCAPAGRSTATCQMMSRHSGLVTHSS